MPTKLRRYTKVMATKEANDNYTQHEPFIPGATNPESIRQEYGDLRKNEANITL